MSYFQNATDSRCQKKMSIHLDFILSQYQFEKHDVYSSGLHLESMPIWKNDVYLVFILSQPQFEKNDDNINILSSFLKNMTSICLNWSPVWKGWNLFISTSTWVNGNLKKMIFIFKMPKKMSIHLDTILSQWQLKNDIYKM